jgi:hypothetical protein
MKLDTSDVKIKDPHVKMLVTPINIIKISGIMSVYRNEDSNFENILVSYDQSLYSSSKI